MQETIITCGDGGFFPIVIFLIIIISIITNAVKAAKEKKEREERMRGSGGSLPKSSPSPYTQKKQQSTSIEDFLRELSGAPAKKPQPKRQTEWHAPQQQVDAYKERKDREEERKEKLRRQREQEQRERDRERESKQGRLEREREKRQKLRRRKKRVRAGEPATGLIRESIQEPELKKRRKPVQAGEDAYHIKEHSYGDAYDVKASAEIGDIDITSMEKSDLKRAVILKEILGEPVGLRKRKGLF